MDNNQLCLTSMNKILNVPITDSIYIQKLAVLARLQQTLPLLEEELGRPLMVPIVIEAKNNNHNKSSFNIYSNIENKILTYIDTCPLNGVSIEELIQTIKDKYKYIISQENLMNVLQQQSKYNIVEKENTIILELPFIGINNSKGNNKNDNNNNENNNNIKDSSNDDGNNNNKKNNDNRKSVKNLPSHNGSTIGLRKRKNDLQCGYHFRNKNQKIETGVVNKKSKNNNDNNNRQTNNDMKKTIVEDIVIPGTNKTITTIKWNNVNYIGLSQACINHLFKKTNTNVKNSQFFPLSECFDTVIHKYKSRMKDDYISKNAIFKNNEEMPPELLAYYSKCSTFYPFQNFCKLLKEYGEIDF